MKKFKMNSNLNTGFLAILVIFLGSFNGIAQSSDPNVRDLLLLSKWFEGEFDNDSQNWYEGRGGWPGKEEEKHERIHVIHTRINAPEIGEYVFYIEEYTGGDSTKVGRQRIVNFKSNAPKETIEMELYFLRDSKKYLGTYATPKVFDGLKKESLFGLDGCNVFFKRIGEQYHGSMKDKSCQFGEGDLKRYSVHDMIISENQYWRVDQTYLVKDNSFYKGHPNDIPHKMRKVDWYSCDIAFHEKAYYLPSEKDKRYNDILIHDQGGSRFFENPVDGKTYKVQLREKQYPFYKEGSDFFMVRLIEKGQRASVALAFAQPDPDKAGFQMGWASCVCEKVESK
ncbi:chromophore lyase CpcT/CpeT [uncultured Croceitalea sp.]|uniref:chromophore lyase CpcT/CpeT n=1 Tax=uncultured Croceitalea sp. TaxID=1798908 RepID=UPI0033067BF6